LAVVMQGFAHTLREEPLMPAQPMTAIHPEYQPKRLESGAPAAAQRSLAMQASMEQGRVPGEAASRPGSMCVRLACGGLQFGRDPGHLLPGLLPALVVVNGPSGKVAPWLADTLQMLAREAKSSQPGRQAVVDHLVQVIFTQAIRAALATEPDASGSGLGAVLDPDIGPALKLMHTDPHLPWTVATLADRVGMSRSAFAARFKALVSKPPLQYLLEYRMEKALALLSEGQCGLKQIAAQVGYATGSTFSNAFKRWSGAAPRSYRRASLADAEQSPLHPATTSRPTER
jgi:AraC-like DNA-binding protein